MKVIDPYVQIYADDFDDILTRLEVAGRKCYKSEGNIISGESRDSFLAGIIKRGHESVLEHGVISACFVVDRGISHEIVRHRIAAYSQESTRYCNYSGNRFGNEITVINPFFFEKGSEEYIVWESCCKTAEVDYMRLLKLGRPPQEARSVLPNSLKTEIFTTYNIREWRHFFRLRCAAAAHPQMRQVSIPLLLCFRGELPVLFDDIEYDLDFPEKFYAAVY